MTSLTIQQLSVGFADLSTPNIGDAMDRLGVVDSRIKPVWRGPQIAGPAFTVWTRAGDNAYLHRAIAEASPGEIVVVNGQGDETRALLGDLICARARKAGIAGFVVDGAVRDRAGLEQVGMPVFARAISPAGPYKHGPGVLNCPIAIGGVSVAPGDIVVGDEDGVVVVPRTKAPDILRRAESIREDEARRMIVIEDAGSAGQRSSSDQTAELA